MTAMYWTLASAAAFTAAVCLVRLAVECYGLASLNSYQRPFSRATCVLAAIASLFVGIACTLLGWRLLP